VLEIVRKSRKSTWPRTADVIPARTAVDDSSAAAAWVEIYSTQTKHSQHPSGPVVESDKDREVKEAIREINEAWPQEREPPGG
jgi:hypothetical protein